MLHSSLAFAWLFWRQYRYLFFIILGSLFCLGILTAIFSFYHPSPRVARVPIFFFFFVAYFALIGFSFVAFTNFDNADFSRESCFPHRLFLLPVSTGSLVAWPTICGGALMILSWLAIAGLVLRPLAERWNIEVPVEVPLWWPGLFFGATLAWFQALWWTPFRPRQFRGLMFLIALLIVCVVSVSMQDFLISSFVKNVHSESRTLVSEPLLVSLFASLMLIGWVVSYVGVKQARYGHAPDWQAILEPLRKLDRWLSPPQSRTPFASAEQAQMWFEWRRRVGSMLAFLTGLVLAVVSLLRLLNRDGVASMTWTFLSALGTPVFLAGLTGGDWLEAVGLKKPRDRMMPFIATLPMSCVDMVGVILKSALWSTLLAWLVVIVTVPLMVIFTGKLQDLVDAWQQIVREHTPSAIVAGIAAISMWLLVWTWKRRVDSLYSDFALRTGFPKIILCMYVLENSTYLIGIPIIFAGPPPHDVFKIFEPFLTLLPWFLTLLIFGRLLLAGRAFCEILRQGLVEPQTAVRGLAVWLLIASALFVLLALVVPTKYVPVYYVAFAVLFAMPMVRLTAAPLALAWNRHR